MTRRNHRLRLNLGDRAACDKVLAAALARVAALALDIQTPAYWRRVWSDELRARGETP